MITDTPVGHFAAGAYTGTSLDTQTRSLPWLLGGEIEVVLVHGHAGAIATTHVEVIR